MRKFPRILILIIVAVALALLAACGGGGASSNIRTAQGQTLPPTANNYTTCGGQQVPNWRADVFQTNYQAAIQALVDHYKTNSNIGYIRIGLGRGGEINLPQGWNDSGSGACYGGYTTKWGYTAGSDASFTWDAYLQSMVQFEGTLTSTQHPLLVSITPVSGAPNIDPFIAGVAVANGLSFGNQGLEASDITNFPNCGGDWCNLFAQYPQTQIKELQTLGQSCPENASCSSDQLSVNTGPLDPLLPFAVANGANDLELYYQDWLIAYDPAFDNAIATPLYRSSIEAAAAVPGVKMQVLFPPQSGGTDFSDVQTYLMNNSAVDGTVLSIDWSDIDLGDTNAGTHGSYDFTTADNVIQAYAENGKTVNLVFQNTTYGGGNNCPQTGTGSNGNVASNCAMPPWMWTALSK